MAENIELEIRPASTSVTMEVDDQDDVLDHNGSSELSRQEQDNDLTIREMVEQDCEETLQDLLDMNSVDQVHQEVKQNLLLHKCINMGSVEMLTMLVNKMKPQSDGSGTVQGDTCDIRELIDQQDQDEYTTVHIAVMKNNIRILRILLENGGQVTAKGHRDYTPLHIAAENGFSACAQILLDKMSLMNKKLYLEALTTNDETPLMLASKISVKTCRALTLSKLNAGDMEGCGSFGHKGFSVLTKINAKDKDGFTALHHASSKGNSAIIKFLLDHNADYSIENETGVTHLSLAISSGKNDMDGFRLLLGKVPTGNITNKKMTELLKLATLNDSYNCVELLLTRSEIGESVINHQFSDEAKDTLLHLALKRRHYKIALLLLEHKARKDLRNDRREYPVHIVAMQPSEEEQAEEKERLNILKKVMKDIHVRLDKCTIDGESAIQLAVKSGNTVMIRRLLARGCLRLAAIEEAASRGYNKGLKLLLTEMPEQESKNMEKMKSHPIHKAAKHGCLECCETLLETFKDQKLSLAKDDNNMYPIDLAFTSRHEKLKFGCRQHLEVFRFFLGKMEFNRDLEDICFNLHDHCKESIVNGDRQYVEAIVESEWCRVAFDPIYCNETSIQHQRCSSFRALPPNDNFTQLVRCLPDIACSVMDRFVPIKKDNVYYDDYTLFNCVNLNRENAGVLPALGDTAGVNNPSSPETQARESPSPCPSGQNKSSPQQQSQQTTRGLQTLHKNNVNPKPISRARCWESHPLMVASTKNNKDILRHPLARKWIRNKYLGYAMIHAIALVFLEYCIAWLTTGAVYILWNSHQIETYTNGSTRHEICSAYATLNNKIAEDMKEEIRTEFSISGNCFNYILEENSTQEIREAEANVPGSATWNKSVCSITSLERRPDMDFIVILQVILAVQFFIHCVHRIYFTYKTRSPLLNGFVFIAYLHIVCSNLMLIPLSKADFYLGIRQDTLWQLGVFSVLLVWLNFVNSLNKIPGFNVFTQISFEFCMEYMQIMVLIFFLILAFALPFYFLLRTVAPGFSSIPHSLMNTLSWMFGDPAYNDTFLNVEAPLKYPIEANIFFSLFIIVFGVVIFNLSVKEPTVGRTEIRNNAAYYQLESMLQMIIFADCTSNRMIQHLKQLFASTSKKKKTQRTKF